MDRGDRLKILRMLCGQSQDGLAKNLGLSQGNVATWERKDMFPRGPEIAKRLAEALQAPVGYLAFGDPLVSFAVWEPQPPQSPRHLKSYISEIKSLLPDYLVENGIELGAYYSAENGKIFLLGQEGKSFSYLLIVKSVIAECIIEAMGGIKVHEVEGLVGYPPLTIFFDEFDLEQLEIFARFFEVKGYSIDRQAIGAALLKLKKSGNGKTIVPHSIENAFRIFHRVLQEYDVPKIWPDELMIRLSYIFSSLQEEVAAKPLVGEFMMDESLAEYLRPKLEGSGLGRRNS
jgi:transcriptional regulator with XRE-family HTH domain